MIHSDLKQLLDEVYESMDMLEFTASDPIQLAGRYSKKQDLEIAAFFSSILAWGQRSTIIKNVNQLLLLMDNDPHQFIIHHNSKDLESFNHFKHRTFNATDAKEFVHSLKRIYKEYGSMEQAFVGENTKERIIHFNEMFFVEGQSIRSRKHIANPQKGSAAKRINMFLRWMVRNSKPDYGLWTTIKPSELMCPLDVHVRRSASRLGLLNRKQSDWKAVEELSSNLRVLDGEDPIKYDLVLFHLSESGIITE